MLEMTDFIFFSRCCECYSSGFPSMGVLSILRSRPTIQRVATLGNATRRRQESSFVVTFTTDSKCDTQLKYWAMG